MRAHPGTPGEKATERTRADLPRRRIMAVGKRVKNRWLIELSLGDRESPSTHTGRETAHAA